jgi:carbon monoxide dehydrogenase subunit G
MRLEQTFTVAAPVERVWDFLMDVPAMAACIPGASDVRPVDDTAFAATVKTKIGPIAASFGCTIAVLELDEARRTGAVEVSGRDSRIGGAVKARMAMAMAEEGGETTVRIVSEVEVLGKIGQYGHGMIGKRANAMLDEFVACARARLA